MPAWAVPAAAFALAGLAVAVDKRKAAADWLRRRRRAREEETAVDDGRAT